MEYFYNKYHSKNQIGITPKRYNTALNFERYNILDEKYSSL
jgi:hypothetical protein